MQAYIVGGDTTAITPDDKGAAESGFNVTNGPQVAGRFLLTQKTRDRRNALNKAGCITSHRQPNISFKLCEH